MKSLISVSVLMLVFIFAACGDSSEKASSTPQGDSAAGSDLTEFEMEHGIGPIKEIIKLSAIDKSLAEKGNVIFDTKCSACHKLDERYVGPAQRDVLKRRSPEYIMNMIVNPDEMLKRHPETKKMLAEYMTPMTNQNITVEDARAVLEYFRVVAEEKK